MQAAAADLPAAFQGELDALRSELGYPGATAACVLPDGESVAAATGWADLEAGTPMTPHARMLSASIGKTYVAATAVALAREGTLDLDLPVSRWIGDRPWFSRLPNHDTMTLRHLLTHSAGLPDHVHLDRFAEDLASRWMDPENPFPPEALIGYILDLPPLFEAGAGWAYSDTGYILAGLVIEAATGRRLPDEITARFLTPLDLTMTSPSDRRRLPGLVAGYTAGDNAFGFPRKSIDSSGGLAWHPDIEGAGGGWVSTAHNLARWGAALFGGTAMEGDYLDDLLKAVPVTDDTTGVRYGAGVALYPTGPFGPVYGHRGWIPGYVSSLLYYPEHDVTIAFQINADAGMLEETADVLRTLETRLAQVVIKTEGKKEP